jgi:dihydrofolate reductase
VVLTRNVDAIAPDPSNPKATLWNPAGASFEAACEHAGVRSGTVAIIGGPQVFGMFMGRYDAFWLSQAPRVRLPDGEPCFPGVPQHSPQAILAAHGLHAGQPQMLDPADEVTVTPWRRSA